MNDAGRNDAGFAPGAEPGEGFRQLGVPAVAVAQRQNVVIAGVHARREHGHFIGFRTAVGEIAFLQLAGRNLGHLLSQRHHGLGGEQGRSVLQAVNLGLDFRGHFFIGVAHADGDNAAQKVEILLAVHVEEVLALAVVEHQRVFVIGGDAVEQIVFVLANNFVFGHSSILQGVV